MSNEKRRIILPGEEQPVDIDALGGIGQLLKHMQNITGYLNHLENGLIAMSHEVNAQGLGLQMILRMFVDKGLATEEEVKMYHKKYVFEPMQRAVSEMQEKVKEAKKEAEELYEQTQNIEDVPELEEDSDVVLASERASKVMRFPNERKED